MNIFVLDISPAEAAKAHCDKHAVKMILEYAQLLSTAHRYIDGKEIKLTLPSGKTQVLRILSGETYSLQSRTKPTGSTITKYFIDDLACYNSTHHNHPCAIWARETSWNYSWLFSLFQELCLEYSKRYGKIHKTYSTIGKFLSIRPKNIKDGILTAFAQAMPEEFKVTNDPVMAYQNYYLGSKASFAKWTNRETPTWFKIRTKDYDATNFERTIRLD